MGHLHGAPPYPPSPPRASHLSPTAASARRPSSPLSARPLPPLCIPLAPADMALPAVVRVPGSTACVLILLAAVTGRTSAAGLVDDPIAGAAVTYLDGGDWTLTPAHGKPPPQCAQACCLAENTDWRPLVGNVSGHPVPGPTDPKSCCAACADDATCVVSVWSGDSCWLKDASAMAGGSYERTGRTSCVPKSGPPSPPPPPITGTVPGDLLTDLETAGLIGDPLTEINFKVNSSLWNSNIWTYSKTFQLDQRHRQIAAAAPQGTTRHLLVFDGIKMGARISVDGKLIGNATDQFLRYVFPLEADASLASHTVEVAFDSSIDVAGRYMACTGKWFPRAQAAHASAMRWRCPGNSTHPHPHRPLFAVPNSGSLSGG